MRRDRKSGRRGAWVAQSVKRLDFGSGHDLTAPEVEPHFGLLSDSVLSLPGILSLSPVPPDSCTPVPVSLSLSFSLSLCLK